MKEFACPRCGGPLPGGTNLASCPACQDPLIKSVHQPPTASSSSTSVPELDVAGLMRRALAEQQPGEEIETALRRVMQGQDPQGEEMVYSVVCENLKMQEWRLGITRQQAAEQLAEADSRLRIMPDGKPFLETLVMNFSGLESVPASMREQVIEQVKESLAHGKTGPVVIRTAPTPQRGTLTVVLTIAVLASLAAIYLWSRLH